MGFKYRVANDGIYYMTVTVIDWIDVFTRKELANVIIESLVYCQRQKGLVLYAWCLMPSHLHLIASAAEGIKLTDVMRDFKKFTSKAVVSTIEEIRESRKEWLLDILLLPVKQMQKTRNTSFGRTGCTPSSWMLLLDDVLLPVGYVFSHKIF